MSEFSPTPFSPPGTLPEAVPPMEKPQLDNQIRCIWDIEFDRTDLEQLLQGSELRISSTTLNAFAAVVQNKADSVLPQTRDFIIFSSWIPALATGERPQGKIYGTIESHIMAAVSNFE